jgi:hypothetical protein
VIVVITAGVGVWVSRSTSSATSRAEARVTQAQLPSSGYWFTGLSADDAGLSATGTVASTSASALCAIAPIDTTPLATGAVRTGSCSEPTVHGSTVQAVITETPATGTGAVALAVTNPTSGLTSTGPTVMTFADSSDTRPIIASGGGTLWIYDSSTPAGAQVVEASSTTGQVTDSGAAPKLDEPVMAADSNGLWLGNSIRGGGSPGLLFHLSPGGKPVSTVLPDTDKAVDWLLADDGHVWAGIRDIGGTDETLWRFDGPGPTVAFHAPEPGLFTSSVVGGEADGLWTAIPNPPLSAPPTSSENKQLDVVRIDPDTGSRSVQATLPALPLLNAEAGTTPGQAAYFDGSFYLLEPPFLQDGYGYSTLARITPTD